MPSLLRTQFWTTAYKYFKEQISVLLHFYASWDKRLKKHLLRDESEAPWYPIITGLICREIHLLSIALQMLVDCPVVICEGYQFIIKKHIFEMHEIP